jgi:hypothetical protein
MQGIENLDWKVGRSMDERFGGGGASVGGTPFTGARPSRTFPQGRECREEGCDTKLSIYNEGAYCFLHEQGTVQRLRGKKSA